MNPVQGTRLRLIDNGYRIVECMGKVPLQKGWQKSTPTVESIAHWRAATNTGIILGHQADGSDLIAIDIDTLDPTLALEIEKKTQALLGANPLVRIGRAPKRLLIYHCAIPRKIKVWLPNNEAVEILTEGQQFICDGVHPDTGEIYYWPHQSSPETVALEDVPATTPDAIQSLLDWLCREKGGRLSAPAGAKPNGTGPHPYVGPTTTPIGGFHTDDREGRMTRLVWAAVVGAYREAPFIDTATAEALSRKVWLDYLAHTESRIAGSPDTLTARLEREGRGLSLFTVKWQRAIAQWDGKVAEAAALPDPNPDTRQGGAGGAIPQAAATSSNPLFFTPYTWRDPATIPPRRFLYGRHYIRQFLSVDIAPGGVGKSSLAIADAVAMVAHKPLLGLLPTERVKVAYWNGEDPLDELHRRVQAVALHHGLVPEDLNGRLFIDSGRLLPLIIARQSRDIITVDQAVVDAIIASITAGGIDVLIIDPFIASHQVSENDNNAIELVSKTWAHIADVTNCSINLIHHSRKTNGEEVTIEAGRGASALIDASRSVRALNQMTKEEAEKTGIKNRRLYFRVDDGKSTLMPPTEAATWYHLASIDLPNGPMGTTGDQVGVVTVWTLPDAFSGLDAADLRTVQNEVGGGKWRENIQANNWVGKAVAKALALTLPDDKLRIKTLVAAWLKSGALVIVSGFDAQRRERDFVEVGTWVESDA